MRWVLNVVDRHRRLAVTLVLVQVAAALVIGLSGGGASAGIVTLPVNDLNALLALTGYPTPTPAPLQENPEPVLAPGPRANCGTGSHPLAGVQGRVPASAIDSADGLSGWTCNVSPISHFATPGGFRVWRYVDLHGHECAFYDTSLASPLNVVRVAAGPSPGVAVLDMSDPAHPVQTDTLRSLPMLAPHESLNLNSRRGLLAAELGNGATLPGLMSIYDVSQDCRHPVLNATTLAARFGHESGFSPDGNTFWIAGGEGIAAVDVSDPHHPRTLWDGNVFAHGLNINDDGTRLYDADPINGNLAILDVSQIQARAAHPVVKEISRLTWGTVTIPQNTAPMTINGRRYLLEFDEFGFRFSALPPPDTVGGARIIDITDEAHPRVVSNLRLEVNQPAQHRAADGDPSPLPLPLFTYSSHYCAIPREVNPEIVACSFINSGLRIFNIQDPLHPREVGYYIAPPRTPSGNGAAGDFALSQPAFVPSRREVWYTDATSGFYNLRLDPSIWPDPTGPAPVPTSRPRCRAATGRLAGSQLGPVALGQRRGALRTRSPRFSIRGNFDVFCLRGPGIRVGYLSATTLRTLSAQQRRRYGARAVIALTANRHYSLQGLRAGMRAPRGRGIRRLHVLATYKSRSVTWYLTRVHGAHGVLRIRRGVVTQIGVAVLGLTDGAHARRFLAGFR
jgi:hypothetical protein